MPSAPSATLQRVHGITPLVTANLIQLPSTTSTPIAGKGMRPSPVSCETLSKTQTPSSSAAESASNIHLKNGSFTCNRMAAIGEIFTEASEMARTGVLPERRDPCTFVSKRIVSNKKNYIPDFLFSWPRFASHDDPRIMDEATSRQVGSQSIDGTPNNSFSSVIDECVAVRVPCHDDHVKQGHDICGIKSDSLPPTKALELKGTVPTREDTNPGLHGSSFNMISSTPHPSRDKCFSVSHMAFPVPVTDREKLSLITAKSTTFERRTVNIRSPRVVMREE
ncbi:hypothetical protein MOQ_003332 [Trypanosoma cruzi marinkellei]|uniref:Uncharacterized protein n=1 Tax=Trypanosoma cruzi marinkellei TaxID=85056 RepID=K2ND37_TRYCR|nr:hypothetical protein MOQ_003332 [Trypanosoma cruzi marinkellei]